MNNKIIIAVDAMGGDNSPKKIVDGIELSLKESKENFFKLYGNKDKLNFLVNKKMKALIKLFYEILIQCNNWKYLQIDNKNNLLLNFFSNKYDNKILTNKLVNYFDKFAFFIEYISLNSITKGVFNFVYKE